MDGEVPEYLAAGVSRDRDGSLRSLDDYYLTHELLELLHHADAGAGSSVPHGYIVDEKPSLNPHPSPSSPPLPTCYAAVAESSARPVASEAEMASWLCQIFEQQEASDLPNPWSTTTTTSKSEEESTACISIGASEQLRSTSAGTQADERPRSSGRKRSGSGKAAEQRRRDKINDKMKTLQQLMPRCTKTDKASTLEHVIQHVKSLQHQLQMLSASGYAMPMPPGVVPPSCMQLAGGGVLGGPAPVMLPPYPFVPAVFACPHPGHVAPSPQQQHQQQPALTTDTSRQRRQSNDLAVPSQRTSHKE